MKSISLFMIELLVTATPLDFLKKCSASQTTIASIISSMEENVQFSELFPIEESHYTRAEPARSGE